LHPFVLVLKEKSKHKDNMQYYIFGNSTGIIASFPEITRID